MNPVLAEMIDQFRAAQDRGVAVVVDVLGPALGVRLPSSNREWVVICGETGLYRIRDVDGLGVYAHGFGIELTFDGLAIDLDWGDAGEPDGFDAWRLWKFVQANGLAAEGIGMGDIRAWLDDAAGRGELFRDSSLYYSPAHRAIFQAP